MKKEKLKTAVIVGLAAATIGLTDEVYKQHKKLTEQKITIATQEKIIEETTQKKHYAQDVLKNTWTRQARINGFVCGTTDETIAKCIEAVDLAGAMGYDANKLTVNVMNVFTCDRIWHWPNKVLCEGGLDEYKEFSHLCDRRNGLAGLLRKTSGEPWGYSDSVARTAIEKIDKNKVSPFVDGACPEKIMRDIQKVFPQQNISGQAKECVTREVEIK